MMIDDFDRAWLKFVHPEECWGGAQTGTCRISDNPKDKGGRTLHGVAERYHPEAWKDGPPSIALAGEIMRRDYWLPAQCDKFDWPLNLVVFDWAVNAGEDNPAAALQRIVGAKVDGDIGPKTVAKTREWAARMAAKQLVRARRAELLHNAQSGYFRGWFKRLGRLEALVG